MAEEQPKPLVGRIDADKSVVAEHIDTVIISPPPSIPAAVPLRTGVPPVPEHYVPREAMLKELADQLGRGERATVTGRAVASGAGGHGKTVLACAYAHEYRGRYPGGCFAVECESKSLVTALASLVPMTEATDQQRAQHAQAILSQEPRCLLILDNVRDAEQWSDQAFQDSLPRPPCHVLVTTRAEHLPGTREVHVGRLTEDEAFALLAKFRPSATEEVHREAVHKVLREVEYLAAAVAAVGACMMLDEDDDWSAYAEHLEKAPLSELPDESGAVRAETGYAGKTAQVLDDLRARLPAAEVRVLDYAALLPPDQIVPAWLEMLLAADAEKEGGEARLDLGRKPSGKARTPADVTAHLHKLGLLTPAAEDEALLSVHRLHRRRAADILHQQPEGQASRLDSVVAMAEERGEASHEAVTRPDLRSELTPLAALAGELEAAGRFDAAVSLANWIHTPLNELGRYAEGRSLLEPMVRRCESEPDSIAPNQHGTLLNHLALILKDLGELPEARRVIERAIEIAEKHFDPDDPDRAIRYSNLATILKDLGELPEARWRMERAIEIWEKHFDADHPTLATSYSNLATILQALGELPEARRRIERAIEINEKHFDPDHPTLGTNYSNLAQILQDLGDLPEARRRTERAMEIWEKHFDPNHPTLAISYSNLAMILQALGKLPEARRRMERAIEIDQKNFDPDHPSLAIRYSNLATILQALGELPEARRLMERAIEIAEKHFQPDHPHLVTMRKNLDLILRVEAR